jgi:hypothetical protein
MRTICIFIWQVWSWNYQQITHSPHFIKSNIQLGVNLVDDIVVISTSISFFNDVNYSQQVSCNINCWICLRLNTSVPRSIRDITCDLEVITSISNPTRTFRGHNTWLLFNFFFVLYKIFITPKKIICTDTSKPQIIFKILLKTSTKFMVILP